MRDGSVIIWYVQKEVLSGACRHSGMRIQDQEPGISGMVQEQMGHLDGVDSNEALVGVLHEWLQAHLCEARPQLLVHALVPRPHSRQPLLAH